MISFFFFLQNNGAFVLELNKCFESIHYAPRWLFRFIELFSQENLFIFDHPLSIIQTKVKIFQQFYISIKVSLNFVIKWLLYWCFFLNISFFLIFFFIHFSHYFINAFNFVSLVMVNLVQIFPFNWSNEVFSSKNLFMKQQKNCRYESTYAIFNKRLFSCCINFCRWFIVQ